MDMWAAAVLPFKAEPVVSGTKDSNIEGIDKFDDALAVSYGGVLLDGFVVS